MTRQEQHDLQMIDAGLADAKTLLRQLERTQKSAKKKVKKLKKVVKKANRAKLVHKTLGKAASNPLSKAIRKRLKK